MWKVLNLYVQQLTLASLDTRCLQNNPKLFSERKRKFPKHSILDNYDTKLLPNSISSSAY